MSAPTSSAAPVASTTEANTRTLAIETIARKYELPIALVIAIARTEAGLNRYAMRCEPGYRYLWDVDKNAPFQLMPGEDIGSRLPPKRFKAPAGISTLTEWLGQQTSWGPMQVMGALARSYGFRGHFPELSDPMVGADIGCRLLASLRDRFYKTYGWPGVIAAYNAGTPRVTASHQFENQSYVDLVLGNGAKALIDGGT